MNIENLKCLVNSQTIMEASAIGMITFILGIIFIKISEKKKIKLKIKIIIEFIFHYF